MGALSVVGAQRHPLSEPPPPSLGAPMDRHYQPREPSQTSLPMRGTDVACRLRLLWKAEEERGVHWHYVFFVFPGHDEEIACPAKIVYAMPAAWRRWARP